MLETRGYTVVAGLCQSESETYVYDCGQGIGRSRPQVVLFLLPGSNSMQSCVGASPLSIQSYARAWVIEGNHVFCLSEALRPDTPKN